MYYLVIKGSSEGQIRTYGTLSKSQQKERGLFLIEDYEGYKAMSKHEKAAFIESAQGSEPVESTKKKTVEVVDEIKTQEIAISSDNSSTEVNVETGMDSPIEDIEDLVSEQDPELEDMDQEPEPIQTEKPRKGRPRKS